MFGTTRGGLVQKAFACVNYSNSFLHQKWKRWPSCNSQVLSPNSPRKLNWKKKFFSLSLMTTKILYGPKDTNILQ